MRRNGIAIGIAAVLACCSEAETIDVKDYGSVSLRTFSCDYTRSSVVKRICYDQAEQFMIIKLNEAYFLFAR